MSWSPVGVWPLKSLKVDTPPKKDRITIFGSIQYGMTHSNFTDMLPDALSNDSLVQVRMVMINSKNLPNGLPSLYSNRAGFSFSFG
jgi:hypothetical protein